MSREKDLAKNTIIITIGKICTQFISFFLLPLYTAVLSTEEYGTVDLLNTYISLLIPLIILQIEQAIFRFLIDKRGDEEGKEKLISTTFFVVCIQSIAYLIIYAGIARFIQNDYKYFLATNVVANIFASIMLQITRGLGDNITYTKGSFFTALFTILFNIVFILGFKWGAYGMLTASLLANVLCTIYIFIKMRIYKYVKIKSATFSLLKSLWKYSVPLIPNAISWWIVNVSDRTIVTYFLGVGQNGIYSAANKFSGMYITFYNIFNLSWTESAALHVNDEDNSEFFSKIINTTLKMFFAVFIAIVSVMPFVFPILINIKFQEAYVQIPILLLGSLFNVIIGLVSVVYVAKKLTKKIAQTSVIAAVINIIINLLAIKYIGLYAASISTLIAYATMAIVRVYDVKKYIALKLDRKFIISASIITIFVMLSYYMNYMILNIVTVIVVVIYCFFSNKEIIYSVKDIIKKKIEQVRGKLR